MGNNRSRVVLKRNDPKRQSQRGLITENEDIPQMSGETSRDVLRRNESDSNEDMYLINLGKSLSRHEDIIENFVMAAEAQQGMVDRHLKLLSEKTDETADNSSHEKSVLPDWIKEEANILKKIQKSNQSFTKSLTNSVKDIRCDITKSLQQFGKDVSIIARKHRKEGPENVQKGNIEEELKRLKRTVANQEEMNKEMQRQNKILQNEIEQHRPANVSATVQLFYNIKDKSVDEIEKELKTTLTSKLGTVNFITCRNASDIDDKKLIIVVCFVSTRLGAAAANAIKDIQNPGNAALLIIHLAEAHSLPDQKSSRDLTDQNFKNLRGIFDMAFKSGNGFFQCDLNERSIKELCLCCKKPPLGDRF